MTGTAERLASAFHSRDLGLEDDKRKDADYLIALGIAGQRNGLSSDVLRLHLAGSRADYRAARTSTEKLAWQMNDSRGWRLNATAVRAVAAAALAHHVFPVCPVCTGRKFEVAEGAPMLSGNICRPCHGTGLRPVQRKWNGEIRDVMEVLERIGSITERAVTRMMR